MYQRFREGESIDFSYMSIISKNRILTTFKLSEIFIMIIVVKYSRWFRVKELLVIYSGKVTFKLIVILGQAQKFLKNP